VCFVGEDVTATGERKDDRCTSNVAAETFIDEDTSLPIVRCSPGQ
jgi:hypothetical protein